MTRDDIIRLACETCIQAPQPELETTVWAFDGTGLERFAALIAAAEREACAKVCEDARLLPDVGPLYCAVAIRARGESE